MVDIIPLKPLIADNVDYNYIYTIRDGNRLLQIFRKCGMG